MNLKEIRKHVDIDCGGLVAGDAHYLLTIIDDLAKALRGATSGKTPTNLAGVFVVVEDECTYILRKHGLTK